MLLPLAILKGHRGLWDSTWQGEQAAGGKAQACRMAREYHLGLALKYGTGGDTSLAWVQSKVLPESQPTRGADTC